MIVNLPKLGLVEFDDSLSTQEFHSQLTQLADKYDFEIPGPDKHGIINAFKSGVQGWWGSAERGVGEMLGSEGLQKRGEQNVTEAEGAYAPTSEKDVGRAFDRGILPGIGAAFEHYVGEPIASGLGRFAVPMVGTAVGTGLATLAAPEVAAGAGIAEIAAAANAAARAKNIAGTVGFTAPDFAANVGENAAYQQQVNPDQPVNTGAAVAAGLGQAALDRFGIPVAGLIPKGLRGALGASARDLEDQVAKGAITREAAVDALGSKYTPYLKSIGSNYAGLVSMGVGDEALRRAQAGQDFMAPEAVQAYKDQLAGGIAPALLFGAGHEFLSGTRAKDIQNIQNVKRIQSQHEALDNMQETHENTFGGAINPLQERSLPPTIITPEALDNTGLKPIASFYKQLSGKNLTDPADAKAVRDTYEAVNKNFNLPKGVRESVLDLIRKAQAAAKTPHVMKEVGTNYDPTKDPNTIGLQAEWAAKQAAEQAAKEQANGTEGNAPDASTAGEGLPVSSGPEPLGGTTGAEPSDTGRMVVSPEATGELGGGEGAEHPAVEPGTQGELFPEAAGPRAGIEAEEPTAPTPIETGQGEMFGPRGGVTKEALQKPAKPSAKTEPEMAETPVPAEEQAPTTSAEMPAEEAPVGEPSVQGKFPITDRFARALDRYTGIFTAGKVVYAKDGIALIRAIGADGKIKYHPISDTHGPALFDDVDSKTIARNYTPKELKELRDVKKRIEAAAAEQHKKAPFVKFKDGLGFSDGVPHELRGVLREWKRLLGMESDIYFSTLEDARRNADNFTGPYRKIGMYAGEEGFGGFHTRVPEEGKAGGASHVVVFDGKQPRTLILETLAHEMGHGHEQEAFANAPLGVRNAIRADFEKWLAATKGIKTAKEHIESMRPRKGGKLTEISPPDMPAEDMPNRRYWLSFSEWYADQVSRWAVSSEKPVSVVEKFFARLGAALRKFYNSLRGQQYFPTESMKQFLDSIAERVHFPDEDITNTPPRAEAPRTEMPEATSAEEPKSAGPGDHLRPIIDAALDRGAIEIEDAGRLNNLLDSGRPEDIAQVQAELAAAARRSKAARLEEIPPIRKGPRNKQEEDEGDKAAEGDYAQGEKKFSEATSEVPTERSTKADVHKTLDDIFQAPKAGRRKVTVYETEAEARAEHPEVFEGKRFGQVQAFTIGKKVHLVAENIPKGRELSVLLHEIGVHAGMEKLVGPANMKWLSDRVDEWAARNDNSLESRIARKAVERAERSSSKNKAEEKIAYMVEEAINAGVDPKAISNGKLGTWFRKMLAAFKVALRKLGFKSEKFTVQHLVDMAHGAAHMELEGAHHGTAAEFRKFNHDFMGSGEGAQAYGWGTYLAKKFGIGKDYMVKDINRKAVYGGITHADGSRIFGLPSYEIEDILYRHANKNPKDLNRDVTAELVAEMHEKNAQREESIRAREQNIKETIKPAIEKLKALIALAKDQGERSAFNLEKLIRDKEGFEAMLAHAEKVLADFKKDVVIRNEDLEKIQREGLKVTPPGAPKGGLMHVTHDVREHEWLDYDRPIEEQSKTVQDAVKKLQDMYEKAEEDGTVPTDPFNGEWQLATGEEIYNAVREMYKHDVLPTLPEGYERTVRSKEAASKFLDSLGVKGIKFLDNPSRDKDKVLAHKDGSFLTDAEYKKLVKVLTKMTSNNNSGWSEHELSGLPPADLYGNPNVTNQQLAYLKDRRDKEADRQERQIYEQRIAGLQQAKYFIKQEGYTHVDAPDATHNYVVFNDKNLHRVATMEGAKPDEVKFSETEPLNKDIDNFITTAPSNIAKLPPVLQTPVRAITQTLFGNLKSTAIKAMLTEDVAQLARKYMKSVTDYISANQMKREAIRMFENGLLHLRPRMEALPDAVKNEVNKFIGDSTYSGKWGYDPGIPGVKADLEMEARFKALPSDEARAIVKAVFEHGVSSLKQKQDAIRGYIDSLYADKLANATDFEKEAIQKQKDEVLKKFKSVLELNPNTPYAPLKRFGPYVVVAKSKEYWEAEKNEDWKEVKRLREGGDHYVVEFADTMGEAHAIRDELAAMNRYSIEEPFKRSEARDRIYSGPDLHSAFAELRRKLDMTRADKDLDDNAKKMYNAMDDLIQDLYLSSLADSSARKSEITRKRIAGYNQDMMRSFFTQGMADAKFIANLQHNGAILDALSKMSSEAKMDRAKANPYLNEFMAREALNMQMREPSWLDTANRLTGDWYLTFSPSFYLQQSLQTYTFSLPRLAARFGYFKSSKELTKSYGEILQLLNKTGINDNVDLKNLPSSIKPEEIAMLDHLIKTGIIDVGVETSLHGYYSEKGITEPYAKVTNMLRSGINKIEVLNRATAALTAFRLAMEKTAGDTAKATELAYDTVRVTHGSYDGFNTPRLFNTGPVARSISQFRRFQIIQLTMLAKQMHGALAGATPEERAIARKEFGFLLGHSMALGGLKGLPFWAVGSAAYTIVNNLFGDEESQAKDFEAWVREKTDGSLLLTKGIPAWMGIDTSGKLAMGNTMSIAPYTDFDISSSKGYAQTMLGFAGPFAGGLLPNMANGVGMAAQGDYYKGLEQFMPNGVANSMKGYRFVTDGVTNKSGDMLMSPADITWVDGLMQSLGLPTTNLTERSYRASEMFKTQEYFQNTQKDVAHQYEQAFKDGNADGMQEARQRFLQLQNARAANGFTRLPLTTLTKDVEAQRKREHAVVGGVETTKQNIGFARALEQQSE